MQDPEALNRPLDDLAKSLRSLQPAAARTSERDIWYQAGLEAGHRPAATWRAATCVLGILSVGLFFWNVRPAPMAVERAVHVTPDRPSASPQVAASSDVYGRLREGVLRNGLDGLPPPDFSRGGEPVPHHGSVPDAFPFDQRG